MTVILVGGIAVGKALSSAPDFKKGILSARRICFLLDTKPSMDYVVGHKPVSVKVRTVEKYSENSLTNCTCNNSVFFRRKPVRGQWSLPVSAFVTHRVRIPMSCQTLILVSRQDRPWLLWERVAVARARRSNFWRGSTNLSLVFWSVKVWG